MSKNHNHKPVRAAQPGPQEVDIANVPPLDLPKAEIAANAVLAALDSKDLTPDARRRLGAHLRSLLQDGENATEQPISRDPKTGAFLNSSDVPAPKPKKFERRKRPVEGTPKIPLRVVKRQVAEYREGTVVYGEKHLVQWFNPETHEFWDLPIVNEDDDYELVEVTE